MADAGPLPPAPVPSGGSPSLPPSNTSTRSERAAVVLRRVLDITARVVRGLTVLAIAAAVFGTIAWIVWLIDSPPAETDEWIPRIVVLVVALAPPAILFLFLAGLRDLLELPDRARALPADVRARASELRERSRPRPDPRGVLGVLVALFRLGRLVLGSREVLSPYAAIAAALRPAILLAALVAGVAALIEIPVAAIALLLILQA
jgi:hypothetical protein